ncbi:ankyrin repeat domain-containing protein [Candidatus Skiveiella danica]|uniref:ankyrin repeat domain-containing protein n=1 Tax=Candidatus Skiveiella danica TaxID=3386177 RepID=UPI001D2856AD|nr:ankyrin repeat domain-containing protein [Betaproteobacteria bacterium]
MNRPDAPLPRREATDELVRRYHEASAQDPARPSPALRETVLAQARAAAARSASSTGDAESSPDKTPEWIANNNPLTPGSDQKSSKSPKQATNNGRHAANDSSWRLRAVASVAVLGLATLLFLQFERGTPDERELTSGGPALAPPALPSRPGKAESADTASAPAPLPEPAPTSVLRNTPTPMGPGAAEPQRAPAVQARPAAPSSPGKSAVPATLTGESGNVVAGVSKDAGSLADRAPPATEGTGPTNRALKAAPPATAPIAEPAPAAAPVPATPPAASLGAAAPAPSTAPARALDASPAESRARLAPMPAAAQERAVTTSTAGPATSLSPASQRLLTAALSGSLEAARQALKEGAALNATDPAGQTALMLAARRGDEAVVRLLLAAGADRAKTDAAGRTAADLARQQGHATLATLLIAPESALPAPVR